MKYKYFMVFYENFEQFGIKFAFSRILHGLNHV
jgi:hypothetical protein